MGDLDVKWSDRAHQHCGVFKFESGDRHVGLCADSSIARRRNHSLDLVLSARRNNAPGRQSLFPFGLWRQRRRLSRSMAVSIADPAFDAHRRLYSLGRAIRIDDAVHRSKRRNFRGDCVFRAAISEGAPLLSDILLLAISMAADSGLGSFGAVVADAIVRRFYAIERVQPCCLHGASGRFAGRFSSLDAVEKKGTTGGGLKIFCMEKQKGGPSSGAALFTKIPRL